MTDVIAGRFALCDPIARGGSGVVWRAYDRKLGRFCAAKVLRRRDAGDLLRFVREQSFRLAHHHILAPYSWAAEDTHVVIASELVDGGSLSTLIGDWGPLSEPTVATLLDQLLEALEQVHAAGLVHRDVKPANLLLRASGSGPVHVMLGDFGLTMGAEDPHLTEIGMVVGTPGYLAPEVMRGGVAPDVRHDLYAAGRVAVALLNGIEPRDQSPVPPDAAPGALRELIVAMTALDAQARPATATQARAALRPVLFHGRAVGDGARPRTRAGEPIEVLHQLPPVSDAALAEARAPDSPAGGGVDDISAATTGPLIAGPRGSTAAVSAGAVPTLGQPGHTEQIPRAAPAAHRSSTRRSSTRRRLLLTSAGVLVAAAIAVPVTLAVTGDSSGGGTAPSSGGPIVDTVQLDAVCTWQEQGNEQQTSNGGRAVCTATEGTYLWTKP